LKRFYQIDDDQDVLFQERGELLPRVLPVQRDDGVPDVLWFFRRRTAAASPGPAREIAPPMAFPNLVTTPPATDVRRLLTDDPSTAAIM